jgi:hypothetical protein
MNTCFQCLNPTIEEWRIIEKPRRLYEVSTRGNVRRIQSGRILKPGDTGNGYFAVTLSDAGYRRGILVHCLVARAFIGPTPDGHEVNHKDGKKGHNHEDNLEYKTHLGNMQHAIETGLWCPGGNGDGKGPYHTVLTPRLVMMAQQLMLFGYRPAGVSRIFRVDPTTIRDIKNGVSWRNIRIPGFEPKK